MIPPTSEPFRWQGFELWLPSDWAPVSLIGDRREGYCRFGSPGTLGFQVRWKHSRKPGRLKEALFAYFRLLQKESRRSGKAFESEIDDAPDRISYRWRGHAKATGQLFFSPTCQRIFFLELLGERKDSLTLFGRLAGTFRSLDPSGPDLWSVLGLSVRLPKRANLDSRSFHAGRTLLNFSARGFRAQASRWGFGSQLAERHGISHWAASAFGLPVGDTSCDHDRLEWEGRSRLGWTTRLLVRLDRPSNRIVAVRASYRTPEWRPTWDWLEP